MIPRPSPPLSMKLMSCKTTRCIRRRSCADRLDRQWFSWLWQLTSAGLRSGNAFKQVRQTFPRLAGGDKSLPIGDRKVDRSKCSRDEDRARNDDAGSGFMIDDQIGAKPEHRRLQHQSHDAR